LTFRALASKAQGRRPPLNAGVGDARGNATGGTEAFPRDIGRRRIILGSRQNDQHEERTMAKAEEMKNSFVVTAFWEARRGEEEAVAKILTRFQPQAQQEPGVLQFVIHRSRSEAGKFFFYEVFRNEDAFGAHQQTDHFKTLIAGEALPKLAKRERGQYAVLP
jgi:quinol monooxygenase YgiN